MNLRSHITTSFLALAQALPAQAQEERAPYSTTRECVIQSLRETFAPHTIEVVEETQGVGGFVAVGDGQFSSIVRIDPDTALVKGIDVQVYSDDPAVELYGVSILDYVDGTQSGHFTAGGLGQVPVETAIALARKLDDSMRQCSRGMLLG